MYGRLASGWIAGAGNGAPTSGLRRGEDATLVFLVRFLGRFRPFVAISSFPRAAGPPAVEPSR
jgi:hypothetical protein